MQSEQNFELADYYRQELEYLRTQGEHFSKRYPNVASRLSLHGAESQDPHTERLIESVAFIAARVHRDIKQEMPTLATSVLEMVCPTLIQPVPSITVAQFFLDSSQGKVTSGFTLEKGTSLYAKTLDSQECHFTTAYDATLWPLHIGQVDLNSEGELKLELLCDEGVNFSELDVDSLDLHLQGDLSLCMALYDALLSGVKAIFVRSENGNLCQLPLKCWRETGFDEANNVISGPEYEHPAFGLLQEYFNFPRKFHFFEISGLKDAIGNGLRCELIFQLDRAGAGLRKVSKSNFSLGCVPIVNIFSQTSEPILVDGKDHEYLLIADRQRESYTQVHSIHKVMASDPSNDKPSELLPLSAYGVAPHEAEVGPMLWSSRRTTSLRPDIPGTDVFLSFVDRQRTLSPSRPTVVYAQLLCTNRRLAEQVPQGARLIAVGAAQPTRAHVLYEPSLERAPALDSGTLWRLHSLLSLNHLSLLHSRDGLSRLRELLGLFASESRRDQVQIRGISAVKSHGVVTHVGQKAWLGFCRGTQINLEFDESAYVGGSSLLMSAVLAHFFAMYTAMNSFVRVAAVRGSEVRKQWEPMTGRQLVL